MLTEHGVQLAPRTYRSWKSSMPSARTVSDAHLTDALRATVGTPEGMYGRRKMTAYLRRQGHRVAGCTVDRLMRDEGLFGVIRAVRTAPPSQPRASVAERRSARSRLHRGRAEPQVGHRLHLHPHLDGFVYVAFVINCFSRAIVAMPPPLRNRDGDDGPLNTLGDVELITADYVSWFGYAGDPQRLLGFEGAGADAVGGRLSCSHHAWFALPMVVGFRVLGIGCSTSIWRWSPLGRARIRCWPPRST